MHHGTLYHPMLTIYSILGPYIGFVFSVEPLFHTFRLGDTIKLQVNISDDYFASHIRNLSWYHNETEIQPFGRIILFNSGRELIIQNAIQADAGSYRVETASLDFYGIQNPVCDSVWLSFLRNHAAHAPVTFMLRELPRICSGKSSYI